MQTTTMRSRTMLTMMRIIECNVLQTDDHICYYGCANNDDALCWRRCMMMSMQILMLMGIYEITMKTEYDAHDDCCDENDGEGDADVDDA